MSLTPERRRELRLIYKRAVRGTDQAETNRHWFKYLTALWKEDGDMYVFRELREVPRTNGADVDRQLMSGEITKRQAFNQIRVRCIDSYASRLKRFGIAEIDMASRPYLEIRREMGIQVVRAFEGIDPTDKTAVCTAMAKTWNNLVELLHAQYGLPTVKEMQVKLPATSDAEKLVLDSEDFETRMTSRERAKIEAEVV